MKQGYFLIEPKVFMVSYFKKLISSAVFFSLITAGMATAEPSSCKTVRFSDVGWTDITSTTAVTSTILEKLGYRVKTHILSVPVTFTGLKNKDVDIFLGLWMPSMAADIAPYKKDGTVETVKANLKGAKYTLAVPKYVLEAGVKDFSDIHRFESKFGKKIYGIEPGNDGNRLIQDMIDKNAFGLKGWKLVESSEQGMLSQVKRAVRQKKWIAFLAWAPHPMNSNFDIDYLSGGDDYFGPNYGGATVFTTVRKGYLEECPNVGQLLNNLEFSLEMENQIMGWILDDNMQPEKAANKWLKANPQTLNGWLKNVKTFKGQEGLPKVAKFFK